MKKWRCLGCGKVVEAEEEPKECKRCGDSVAESGGSVFRLESKREDRASTRATA